MRGKRAFAVLLLGAALNAGAAAAATELSDLPAIPPPQDEASKAYRKSIAWRRIESDVRYRSGTFRPEEIAFPNRAPWLPDSGNAGVAVVVAILLGAALLWMKFGGSGMLLAPPPARDRDSAPDQDWDLADSLDDSDPANLLKRAAGMADRQAAIVLLLRYCLRFAGRDSATGFARSDTEREAFARLPGDWREARALEALLRRSELAHYGGRMVDEAGFADALAQARRVLGLAGGAHA